ncbi:unnamed protein product [marine sediment metagenome]|uniref:Uncharacterized protein n=1 Tax=marine sediment metagenome TaxID=412755 RepID=X0T910_9ZZZZ
MVENRIPKAMLIDIIKFFIAGEISIVDGVESCLLRNHENDIYAECSDLIELRKEIFKEVS